jgi:hypothetical protein
MLLPPSPSFVVKKDIIATKDRQMPLKWKSFGGKSFLLKWSSRYGTQDIALAGI